mgnify:FL=1
MNPDKYFRRSEVSNSDLTALKQVLHPGLTFDPVARDKAFRMGTLVDAVITEPNRVDYYALTVDDEQYTNEEFNKAKWMHKCLRDYAYKDKFLAVVLAEFSAQKVMVNQQQQFTYGGFEFA